VQKTKTDPKNMPKMAAKIQNGRQNSFFGKFAQIARKLKKSAKKPKTIQNTWPPRPKMSAEIKNGRKNFIAIELCRNECSIPVAITLQHYCHW
jgi:hypothetical protein